MILGQNAGTVTDKPEASGSESKKLQWSVGQFEADGSRCQK